MFYKKSTHINIRFNLWLKSHLSQEKIWILIIYLVNRSTDIDTFTAINNLRHYSLCQGGNAFYVFVYLLSGLHKNYRTNFLKVGAGVGHWQRSNLLNEWSGLQWRCRSRNTSYPPAELSSTETQFVKHPICFLLIGLLLVPREGMRVWG